MSVMLWLTIKSANDNDESSKFCAKKWTILVNRNLFVVSKQEIETVYYMEISGLFEFK